ncbi:MAG: hypothetical protein NT125_07810 [Candidatus Bipolaricaulota bacterium]|nr:hypothetical protein [Candidatus Bipolaricaulota bacterium]
MKKALVLAMWNERRQAIILGTLWAVSSVGIVVVLALGFFRAVAKPALLLPLTVFGVLMVVTALITFLPWIGNPVGTSLKDLARILRRLILS